MLSGSAKTESMKSTGCEMIRNADILCFEMMIAEELIPLLTTEIEWLEETAPDIDWFALLSELSAYAEETYHPWQEEHEEGDPFCYGVEINSTQYATGYTGQAGAYWRYDQQGNPIGSWWN